MVTIAPFTEIEYSIKPEAVVPSVDTARWPLLLQNYDRCTYNAIVSEGMHLTCFFVVAKTKLTALN